MKRAIILCLLLTLVGCARSYDVYVMGRSTADNGRTVITVTTGRPGGEFVILLGGNRYTGRWVYMANGGAMTVGNATAFSGGRVATATGLAVSAPTEGGGTIFASAPNGMTLHCQYGFNSWTRSGLGVCKGAQGELFDLQIIPA